MKDSTKIQLLIEEGSLEKIGEKRLERLEGVESVYRLTEWGEKKYGTISNALEMISEISHIITYTDKSEKIIYVRDL